MNSLWHELILISVSRHPLLRSTSGEQLVGMNVVLETVQV